VLVNIALREWPNKWPDMVDLLLNNLASRGLTELQFALNVFRRLSEDVSNAFENADATAKTAQPYAAPSAVDTTARTLPRSRQKAIVEALTNLARDRLINDLVHAIAAHSHALMQQGVSNEEKAAHQAVLLMALNTLYAFTEWAPLEYVSFFLTFLSYVR